MTVASGPAFHRRRTSIHGAPEDHRRPVAGYAPRKVAQNDATLSIRFPPASHRRAPCRTQVQTRARGSTADENRSLRAALAVRSVDAAAAAITGGQRMRADAQIMTASTCAASTGVALTLRRSSVSRAGREGAFRWRGCGLAVSWAPALRRVNGLSATPHVRCRGRRCAVHRPVRGVRPPPAHPRARAPSAGRSPHLAVQNRSSLQRDGLCQQAVLPVLPQTPAMRQNS